ncbi:MAG: hypothetical protein ACRDP3_20770, partial [Streptomyces sp.]
MAGGTTGDPTAQDEAGRSPGARPGPGRPEPGRRGVLAATAAAAATGLGLLTGCGTEKPRAASDAKARAGGG